MIKNASWIGCASDIGTLCPSFKKTFRADKVKSATLTVTAVGVYEAYINGKRVGDFVLAPGCTSYKTRLQYQSYDITDMLCTENELTITVGTGWYRGRISETNKEIHNTPLAMIAEVEFCFEDGTRSIYTDDSWTVSVGSILFSDIYDGETYDATASEKQLGNAVIVDGPGMDCLIPQEGEIVCEHERIKPVRMFTTPKGERVVDFGQNMAGYVEFNVDAKAGERISISHAEILDGDGNFYNSNYRSAKSIVSYTCRDGKQVYKPHFIFSGFRYIRLDEAPENIGADSFTAIAIYSDIKRTGYITTAHAGINKLFENTLWSQRGNFIDIPTDCPQRDERMGWMGDAQFFCKTAGYNYNVKKFFEKWVHDLCAEQHEDGSIPDLVPYLWLVGGSSTGWGDAICVIPWQMYQFYGDKQILIDSFDAMKGWVDFITNISSEKYLWTRENGSKTHSHYGDWLALDAPWGSYRGATDEDFIASAFYAYSTSLLVKTGKAIGREVSEYEELYRNIAATFKTRYNKFVTQTEHVLPLMFDLTDDKPSAAKELAEMIKENGNRLQTGLIGTPYLLHVLSDNGYTDVAYDLLLQENYPSWLYEVNRGATTIWEHWDGIRDDGVMWSDDMNSYNHYVYGSVVDWIYTVAAGINTDPEYPGFERLLIAPKPGKRLGRIDASYETPHGRVTSKWTYCADGVRYEITTPVPATVVIGGKAHEVEAGSYVFFEIQKI